MQCRRVWAAGSGCRQQAAIALEARMTPRALRWATGGVAALSIALLLGGLPLAYLGRHAAGHWNFPDVFEELTFVAVPVAGFVLASRRPANKIGWIFLAGGLLLGLGFFCQDYGG